MKTGDLWVKKYFQDTLVEFVVDSTPETLTSSDFPWHRVIIVRFGFGIRPQLNICFVNPFYEERQRLSEGWILHR
jgi:hypothetical protein